MSIDIFLPERFDLIRYILKFTEFLRNSIETFCKINNFVKEKKIQLENKKIGIYFFYIKLKD